MAASSSASGSNDDGLSNIDLQNMARALHTSEFVGVFSKDQCPNFKRQEGSAIVNLEPASQPGSHWVALGNRHGQSWYFDSFGLDLPSVMKARLTPPIVHLVKEIQAVQSDLCGLYALGACIAVERSSAPVSSSLQQYIAKFNRPILDDNDKILYSYFTQLAH